MFGTSDIEKYFNSEKQESILFFAIGITGIITAVIFSFFFKTNFYKGAAIPLLLIGLMLGIVGFTVYKRSDANRIRNVYAYGLNPTELQQKEIPRMKTVMNNFVVYRWVEIVLALAGVALILFFKDNADQLFWKGLGLTLAIMALIALTADYFAEKRGKIYLKGLQEFTQA
jgi:drug/metabolite transporter (DMT)-like permease